VRKLMAKDPAQRYQSPAEVATVLEEVLHRRTGGAPTTPVLTGASTETIVASSPPLPPPPTPRDPFAEIVAGAEETRPPEAVRDRRWLWLVGGGGLLLAGLVALLVFLALRGPSTLPEGPPQAAPPEEPVSPRYVKRPTREETILATLRASGLPTLEGTWYYIGPFDSTNKQGFKTVYPPEQDIDVRKSYPGKGGQTVRWKEFTGFAPGRVMDLKKFPQNEDACIYLYHPITVRQKVDLPLSLGSDDTLTVWLGGQQLLAKDVTRGAAPDQDFVTLPLRAGKNQLLVKVCNDKAEWGFYVLPLFPPELEKLFGEQLRRDFPRPVP
jgi:hypothetical protein